MNIENINKAKDGVAKKYTIPTNSEFELETGIKEIQCSNWGQLIRHAIRLYYEKHEEEPLNKIINEAISLYHQSAIEEAGRELPSHRLIESKVLEANYYDPTISIEDVTVNKGRNAEAMRGEMKLIKWMHTEASKVIANLTTSRDEEIKKLNTLVDWWTDNSKAWKRLSEEKIVENVKLKKDFDICKRSHDAIIELSEIQNKSFIELKQENDELRKEAKGLKGIVGREVLIKRSIEKDGLPKKNDTYLVENSSHSDLCEFSDGKFLYQRMNIDYWYEPAIFPLLPVKEVGERQDREKLVFDLLNKHLPKDTKWDIETERGVQNAMKELYNQLSTPLPTKQSTGFRLGDIEECLQQMRMGLGLYGLYNAESCKKWAGEYFNKLISLPRQSTKNLSLDGAGKIIKMARAFSYRENGTIVFENSEDQIIQFLTTIEHTEVK